MTTPSPPFDPLTTTASDLSRHLSTGALTSTQIIVTYLAQIATHNPYLHALIYVAPREKLLEEARQLDDERASGKLRGQLHGVPIVLKDAIGTADMPTSVGAWALRGARAKRDAVVVERLRKSGLIVLGKANLTEFCGLKAPYALNERGIPDLMPGCSTTGGQTQSPYVAGGLVRRDLILGHSSPGGSSSGSAVAVAAGLAPLALGTDTAGSVSTPANRAGIYAITLTRDLVPMDGVFGLTKSCDRLGIMAKSATDLALLLEAITGGISSEVSLQESIEPKWKDISLAFADPSVWSLPGTICEKIESADKQMIESYDEVVSRTRKLGAKVEYPAELSSPSELSYKGQSSFRLVSDGEFPVLLENFLRGLTDSPVSDLASLIKYNNQNAEQALPEPYTSQSDLIKCLNERPLNEDVDAARQHLWNSEGLDKTMKRYEVDVIVAPGDSSLCALTAAVGWPIATAPVGTLEYNGRPFGLCFASRAGEEAILLKFMRAYQDSFPARPVPKLAG